MLKQRLASGLTISLVLIVATQWAPSVMALLIIASLSCLGQIEFYSMCRKAGVQVFTVPGLLAGVALITATFFTIGPSAESMANAYRWEQVVLFAGLLAILLRQLPRGADGNAIASISCSLLGIWYVAYTLNFFTRLVFRWDQCLSGVGVGTTGCRLVLYLVLVVKITDVGACFTGRFLGKHKAFPRLSPKKTWEGVAGGVVAAVISSIVFVAIVDGSFGSITIGWVHAVILGLLLSSVGIVGDLFESLLKRASGVKDSGNAVPGMGGVLDVLDSLLFGTPVLYLYITCFLD